MKRCLYHSTGNETTKGNLFKGKGLEISIVLLSIIGGSILPFPETMSIGFAVFCIVNVLQIILFSRLKLFWMTVL